MAVLDESRDEGSTETRLKTMLFLLIVFALPLLVPLMLQSAGVSDQSRTLLRLHNQGHVFNIAERSHPRRIPFGDFLLQNIGGGIKMMKDYSSAAELGADLLVGRSRRRPLPPSHILDPTMMAHRADESHERAKVVQNHTPHAPEQTGVLMPLRWCHPVPRWSLDAPGSASFSGMSPSSLSLE